MEQSLLDIFIVLPTSLEPRNVYFLANSLVYFEVHPLSLSLYSLTSPPTLLYSVILNNNGHIFLLVFKFLLTAPRFCQPHRLKRSGEVLPTLIHSFTTGTHGSLEKTHKQHMTTCSILEVCVVPSRGRAEQFHRADDYSYLPTK